MWRENTVRASVKQHKAKPLFQSEAKYKAIDMEKGFWHLASFWKREFWQDANDLLDWLYTCLANWHLWLNACNV